MGFRVIGYIFMPYNDLAAIGLVKAHDVPKRHRFSDAAASDDRHSFAIFDVKTAIDQNGVIERLINVPELDVMAKLFIHSGIESTLGGY